MMKFPKTNKYQLIFILNGIESNPSDTIEIVTKEKDKEYY